MGGSFESDQAGVVQITRQDTPTLVTWQNRGCINWHSLADGFLGNRNQGLDWLRIFFSVHSPMQFHCFTNA